MSMELKEMVAGMKIFRHSLAEAMEVESLLKVVKS